ncbi:MAG: hypothetical protein RLO01_13950, partial [Thalassobaculaceae bacterium]
VAGADRVVATRRRVLTGTGRVVTARRRVITRADRPVAGSRRLVASAAVSRSGRVRFAQRTGRRLVDHIIGSGAASLDSRGRPVTCFVIGTHRGAARRHASGAGSEIISGLAGRSALVLPSAARTDGAGLTAGCALADAPTPAVADRRFGASGPAVRSAVRIATATGAGTALARRLPIATEGGCILQVRVRPRCRSISAPGRICTRAGILRGTATLTAVARGAFVAAGIAASLLRSALRRPRRRTLSTASFALARLLRRLGRATSLPAGTGRGQIARARRPGHDAALRAGTRRTAGAARPAGRLGPAGSVAAIRVAAISAISADPALAALAVAPLAAVALIPALTAVPAGPVGVAVAARVAAGFIAFALVRLTNVETVAAELALFGLLYR